MILKRYYIGITGYPAIRETEELRASSWQMGRSLIQLLSSLQPQIQLMGEAVGSPCNYAIAFGIAIAYWQINIKAALLGYLHTWATHMMTAGVKLIPLGTNSRTRVITQATTIDKYCSSRSPHFRG